MNNLRKLLTLAGSPKAAARTTRNRDRRSYRPRTEFLGRRELLAAELTVSFLPVNGPPAETTMWSQAAGVGSGTNLDVDLGGIGLQNPGMGPTVNAPTDTVIVVSDGSGNTGTVDGDGVIVGGIKHPSGDRYVLAWESIGDLAEQLGVSTTVVSSYLAYHGRTAYFTPYYPHAETTLTVGEGEFVQTYSPVKVGDRYAVVTLKSGTSLKADVFVTSAPLATWTMKDGVMTVNLTDAPDSLTVSFRSVSYGDDGDAVPMLFLEQVDPVTNQVVTIGSRPTAGLSGLQVVGKTIVDSVSIQAGTGVDREQLYDDQFGHFSRINIGSSYDSYPSSSIEFLIAKNPYAVATTSLSADGVLTVTGTEEADDLAVREFTDGASRRWIRVTRMNPLTGVESSIGTYPIISAVGTRVNRLVVNALAGDDTILIARSVNLDGGVECAGGDGADSITFIGGAAGSSVDRNVVLRGNNGDDTIEIIGYVDSGSAHGGSGGDTIDVLDATLTNFSIFLGAAGGMGYDNSIDTVILPLEYDAMLIQFGPNDVKKRNRQIA